MAPKAALETGQCAPALRPLVLAATILASAMAFIDGAVVALALPILRVEMDASFLQLQWVTNAYTLTLGALILVGGALGDLLGRKRIFLIGTAAFALASLGCALAPTPEFLILARALKGIGAAMMVPQSLAIISAAYPKSERGKAIGLWAASSAITTALGPIVGGFFIDLLSWRAAFWINIPLSILVILLTVWFVRESRNEAHHGAVDWMGAVLVAAGAGLLTYGLSLFSSPEAVLPAIHYGSLFVGVTLLFLFIWWELRQTQPLLQPRLFLNRSFAGANAMTLFIYGALAGSLFIVPFALIGKWQLTATQAGLSLLPFGLIIGLLSQPAGKWAGVYGPRRFLILGGLMVGLALAVMALRPGGLLLGLVLPLSGMAIGMGLIVSPLTTAVMNSVEDAHAGAASGINNTASRLASLFAIAIIGSVTAAVYRVMLPGDLNGSFGALPNPDASEYGAYVAAFDTAFSAGIAVMALFGFTAAAIAFLGLSDGQADREVGSA